MGETALAFDPTTMQMLVRERTAEMLRHAERDRLANQALDALPPRAPRRLSFPRPSFKLRFSLPLLRQRRDVTL